MPAKNIITNQKINPEKLRLAREFRRAMTPAEKILWQALRGNRLNGLHFRRQQIIAGFIVDFYCHAAGLVVEVDGGVHAEQVESDAERDAMMKSMGLRVLRLRNEEVLHDLSSTLRRILEACHTGTK